jgi:hypothetical protein
MATDQRTQRLVLGVLLAVLAVVAWWQLAPSGAPAGTAQAPPRPAPRPSQPAANPAETLAAGVGLDRLAQVPAAPADAGRDPFVLGRGDAFEAGTAGAGGAGRGGVQSAPVPSVPVMPSPPPGPAPPPPITVKFIGVVHRGDIGRVAVLSDGRNVYYGREGEIVDGRWRIVRIGEESLQIEYVDGRGRQTVRLTG